MIMNDNVNWSVFDKHAIYACFVVVALVAMGVKGEIAEFRSIMLE